MSNTIRALFETGQSIWCDNLSRGMIDGGELRRLIELGVVGVTSNPTIFMKAITSGHDYDRRFAELLAGGADTMGVYEGLVLPDIADAADMLRPVYGGTHGIDGYVSLEVSPKLAFDTDGTVREARRLYAALDRPNVLIKVPGTDEGIPAIETLIAEGISVNVTLIFSLAAHEKVMDAYVRGLQRFADADGDVGRVASVASFFVSRVDTVVDKRLAELGAKGTPVDHLLGQVAVANAKLAYERFTQVFDNTDPDSDWSALERRGARVQRPLWASTGVKNPAHPKTKYVDALVGMNTVNTLPPATIEAVLDGGSTKDSIRSGIEEARSVVSEIEALGIRLSDVTDQLLQDGVRLFAESFEELLENLEKKQQTVRAAG